MLRQNAFLRPADALIFILISAAAAWSFMSLGVSRGTKAIVYLADRKYAWYELTGEKRKVAIPTRIGPVWLEIGGGEARVAASPCPNRICVKTGKVRHAHEEVVCVPARLLLVIEGDPHGRAKGEVDAITH